MTIDMLPTLSRQSVRRALSVLLGFAVMIAGMQLHAQAVCAEVKIQIQQKLNIERQGFIATMRIVNGLETTPLQDVLVQLRFKDRDGDDVVATTNAGNTSPDVRFFYREDLLSGIAGGVQGTGTVQPKTTGEAQWLIIPAQGTGGETPAGEIYSIGATLTYKEGTEIRVVQVTPEIITVRPQPLLKLDYFLPGDVYGDDPFTAETEPSEPFSLGVRITNVGAGPAPNVSIESAQPKIVVNNQGLLVGFQIDASYVQDQPAQNTLLIDFGRIEAGGVKVARWVMSTTLSGTFSEFAAAYTHDDEFGGAVTSQLDQITTHSLLKDVRVDLPGRDAARDFLALDNQTVNVYESEGNGEHWQVNSDPLALGAHWAQNPPPGMHDLEFRTTAADPVFVKIAAPPGGQLVLGPVVRSDGKVLPVENVWKSRERNEAGDGWYHFINLFDIGGTGLYRFHSASAVLPSSISGLVYVDADQDGQQDSSEHGLASVTVTIDGTSSSGEAIHRLTASDAVGAFHFGDLEAGNYSLIVGLAQGLVDGTHSAGSAGGQVGADRIDAITVAAGATATGYAFAKQWIGPPPAADLSITASFTPQELQLGPQGSILPTTTAMISVSNLAQGELVTGPANASVVWQLPPGVHIAGVVAATDGVVDVEQSRWTISNIEVGGSAELQLLLNADAAGVFTMQGSVSSAALDPTAINNSFSATLTVNEFAQQPIVTQEIDPAPRVLALVACPGIDETSLVCTNARATQLSALLAGIGVEHTVVTSTLAYREALRSRRYNVHWLAGDHRLLTDQLAEELRSAVRRGDGLLVEGLQDAAQIGTVLFPLLGIDGGASAIMPQPSSLMTGGGVFNIGTPLGPVLNSFQSTMVPTATSTVEARFDTGHEAVISNKKGNGDGQALVFAFDLAASAAQGGSAEWADFVEAALVFLAPGSSTTLLANDFVPLIVRIENPLADPATIEVDMVFSANVRVAKMNLPLMPAVTIDDPRWSIVIPAGQSRTLEVGVRAAPDGGEPQVQTYANWKKAGGDVLLFSDTVVLATPLGLDGQFDLALNTIGEMTPQDPAQTALIDHALEVIDRVRQQKAKPHQFAISELIAAEQSLVTLEQMLADPAGPGLAYPVPVKEASALVQGVGLRWQSLSPRCDSAEVSAVNADAETFWPFASSERLEMRGGGIGPNAPPGGLSPWEWALGTDVETEGSYVRNDDFTWASEIVYRWQMTYNTDGSAELMVTDDVVPPFSPVILFNETFVPAELPGMRSGNALRLSASLDASEDDTPIAFTVDSINGVPASLVLLAGVAPQRDGSIAMYYPAMAAGMSLQGTVQLTFAGRYPPLGSNLSIQLHAGEIACRPELGN